MDRGHLRSFTLHSNQSRFTFLIIISWWYFFGELRILDLRPPLDFKCVTLQILYDEALVHLCFYDLAARVDFDDFALFELLVSDEDLSETAFNHDTLCRVRPRLFELIKQFLRDFFELAIAPHERPVEVDVTVLHLQKESLVSDLMTRR